MIWLTSDNAGPAAPEIMQAVGAINEGYTPGYGEEAEMEEATARLREVFEAPEAAVYLVAVGTAANALALATLVPPWATIYCHAHSHIEEDECGAPEFFTGGAKLTLLDGAEAKIDPTAFRTKLDAQPDGFVHSVQKGALSLTNITELGAVYTPAEIRELSDLAKSHNLPVHLDGARIANALVSSGATPAEMTWRAGVDALSLGGTKNGCLGVEAVVFFDPAKAWEFELRRKRGGHLFSKHRYLAAQMRAYLTDNLWLRLAGQANSAMARLMAGLSKAGVSVAHGGAANVAFVRLPAALHAHLQAHDVRYYEWQQEEDGVLARFVTNWSTETGEIDRVIELIGSA